jgi:DNA-binding transcriptional regulator YiaG
MYSDKTKAKFIVLRSEGLSISRIAERLNISRPTLIKWNEQYHFAINSYRAVELEALHHSILEKHHEDLAHLAKQQKAIAKELSKRNLDDVPTEKLFRIDSLLREEIQKTRAAALLIQEESTYIPQPEQPNQWFLNSANIRPKTKDAATALSSEAPTPNDCNSEANNSPDMNTTVTPTTL